MPEYSQKWTIVHYLKPLPDGTQYHMADWPLHITLASVFAADFGSTELAKQIEALVTGTMTFDVITAGSSQLGDDSPVDVTLIDVNNELRSLHDSLIDLLETNNAVFNTPEYNREGFLPHITVRNKEFFDAGEHITIDSLSVIDLFPGGDWQQRKVVASFNLQLNNL